jgi:hypothetical protein
VLIRALRQPGEDPQLSRQRAASDDQTNERRGCPATLVLVRPHPAAPATVAARGLYQLPVTAPQYRHGRASSLSLQRARKTCMAGLRRPRRNESRSTWHRITCDSNVPSCSWRPPLSNFPIESFRSAGNRSQARTAGAVTVGMPRAAEIATEIIAIVIMAEKIWLKFIEPTREAFRPRYDG